MKAFFVNSEQKIPEIRTIRSPDVRAERMESLMQVPAHRPASIKFNKEEMARTLIPLTQEDKE